MNRRAFLVGVGGLCGGLAGCTGRDRPGNGPESTSPGGTATVTGGTPTPTRTGETPTPTRTGETPVAPSSGDASCSVPESTPDPTTTTPTTNRTLTPGERTLQLGEPYESDGTTVTVRDVRVRKLIRSTSAGSWAHIDVACVRDHQFAVAGVEATDGDGGSILEDTRFAIEIDGTRHPRPDKHWYWAFPPGTYERPGTPAFPVPIRDASTAAVVWLPEDDPPVRWIVPAETVELFGRAPRFNVCSIRVPDSVTRGDSFEASFTVANTGDRNGDFVAEFFAGDISDYGESIVTVPAGTKRTYAKTMDPYYSETTEEVTVTLARGCDWLERAVTVTE